MHSTNRFFQNFIYSGVDEKILYLLVSIELPYFYLKIIKLLTT